MQLKYNRKLSFGSSLIKILIRLLMIIVFFIAAIFFVEKIKFPSPEKKYDINVTNDIKKL